MLAHCEANRPHLQHLGADPGKLEHLLERYLSELPRLRHDAWVRRVDAVYVGVDVTAVGLDPGGDGDCRRVRPAASERCQSTIFGHTLESGNDRDSPAFQCLVEGRAFDRLNPSVAVNAGRLDQLPAHEAARI